MNPAAVRTGSWAELAPEAAPLRLAVFVEEQGVPLAMEWDEDDAVSLHAVIDASDGGTAAATGRLLPACVHWASHDAGTPDGGFSRIGRMAVRADLRGTGLGGRVLDALLEAARLRGDAGVLLHAQCSAEGFYARRGFLVRGAPFDEAGIAHIEMELRF